MRHRNKYTSEHIDFLRQYNNKEITNAEITESFNKKFNLSVKVADIVSLKSKHNLKSNYNPSRFKKGHKVNYDILNCHFFKKGNLPHTTRQIGETWTDRDGYVYVKIAMPGVWKLKHRLLYEQYHNVKLEKKDVVIFLDKDRTNFSKDNLYRTSRQNIGLMNKFLKDKPLDKDITLSMCKLTELMIKASRLRRKKK